MPPQRTIPPAKAIKTERTHEENQERAYIAASRRSDRSLEARVESARRASEIHKRRTGRSLRVTEQDVINEEMYEEEDDDLPQHYRRLTAHLQTHSADFNQRLSAYLTNHVAMRSALDQAVRDSYAAQAAQQAGQAPNPYSNSTMNSTMMQAHMNYQAQIFSDNQQAPYILQNMMPPMPNPVPNPISNLMPNPMTKPQVYLPQQQFNEFDPQPRLTQSLHRQSQNQNHNQSQSLNPNQSQGQTKSQSDSTTETQGTKPAIKSPSPAADNPDRGRSIPTIKSESPTLESIEGPPTPVSEPTPPPQLEPQKRPRIHDFGSSGSGDLSFDTSFLPASALQAADCDFNPFATATLQDDDLYAANLDFASDPLMGMFIAGSDSLNETPPSFDSSLQSSYAGTPAGSKLRPIPPTKKLHVGSLDSTIGGSVMPAQLEATTTSTKRGFDDMSGIAERLKEAVAGATTATATAGASASASGTPGIAAEKWNEWIEPGEWEGSVQ